MPASSNERPRTLGMRTQLAIESDRALVEEHDGFTTVRTPGNPGYHLGNLLIFDRPPLADEFELWTNRFEEQFAGDANVRHAAFAWSIQSEVGEVAQFVQRGYTFDERAVLTAHSVRDYAPPEGLYVRRFRCDNDWNAELELGLATREAQYDAQPYASFKAAQVAYHRQAAQRFGAWFGAFDGPRLTGSCGIFSIGDGVARYVDVRVHPAYRNRGIAKALVSAAGRFAAERFGAGQLVIVADAHGFARTIYERIGFTLYQREGALWITHR